MYIFEVSMKIFIIIVTFLIGLSSLAYCAPQGNSPLEGFWYDSYPVNDSSGGFLFLENGEFYYFHLSDQNIERRYIGTFGEWRILTNNIEIKIEKHFFLQNPVVQQNAPSGKYAIGADNTIKYLAINNSDWQKIGDIQKIISAHFPSLFVKKGAIDKGIELPSVRLPQINNAEISENIFFYQTQTLDNLSADVSETVQLLKNAKRGLEKEWYIGNPIRSK